MSQLILEHDPDLIPMRLTEAEIIDPFPIMEELCDEYTIGQSRKKLWELVETAFSEDGRYNDPRQRDLLLTWHKRAERAIECLYVLSAFFKKVGKEAGEPLI